ncbi:Endonuclease/exonuclease/phosphatase [Chytridium lagenaria]|nr:Endonuclease/exonuclease/phosphatase [Chytridium lagenaria]
MPNQDIYRPPPIPSRPSAMVAPPRHESAAPPPIPSRPPAVAPRPAAFQDVQLKREVVVAPDFSGPVNRIPPDPDFLATREISHKGYIRCWAISGFSVCTAGQQNLRIYYTPTGECTKSITFNDPKISSLAFVPSRHIEDDGRFLWAGLENGDIVCIDTVNGSTIDRKSAHSVAVTHILRYRGAMWTLDENGSLKIWEPDHTGAIVLGSRPRSLRIGKPLWTSSGKTIEIYNPEETSSILQHKFDVGSIAVGSLAVGNVTALAVSVDSTRIVTGHKDGVIIVWDSQTFSRLAVVKSSNYSVTSVLYLPNDYLWAGYQIGKVHVFDVSNDTWVVMKHFQAHQTAVTDIYLDEKIYFTSGQMHVTSLSRIEKGDSSIKFWDGSLQKDWIDAFIRQYESDFATYRNVNLFVGSWNIDANKPDALDSRPPNENTLLQWFSRLKTNPPEIIVINFQELVDLESVEQMLLDATAKKNAGKSNDHRFQLWRDRILRSLREQMGSVYRDVQSQQLVGLFQCVFLLERELNRCKDVASARVKTGLGGFHGNKGGVATRLVLDDSSFCFLNCHLAAHQNQVEARNSDALSIRDSMSFSPGITLHENVFMTGGDGTTILDHENVVIAGDLNYRIELPRDKVIEAIERNDLRFLLDHDQLSKQRATNLNFGFRGEKKRVPSWCDRILWRGSFTQKTYERVESTMSDHRPVSATFMVPVKQISSSKLEQVRSRASHAARQRLAEYLLRAKVEWLRQAAGVSSKIR